MDDPRDTWGTVEANQEFLEMNAKDAADEWIYFLDSFGDDMDYVQSFSELLDKHPHSAEVRTLIAESWRQRLVGEEWQTWIETRINNGEDYREVMFDFLQRCQEQEPE